MNHAVVHLNFEALLRPKPREPPKAKVVLEASQPQASQGPAPVQKCEEVVGTAAPAVSPVVWSQEELRQVAAERAAALSAQEPKAAGGASRSASREAPGRGSAGEVAPQAAPTAPQVAPKAESPLSLLVPSAEFRPGQRVFGISATLCDGVQRNALQMFEELTLLRASPLALFSTGHLMVARRAKPEERGWVHIRHLVADPCSERAYVVLMLAGNADGLVAFLERLVARLGGGIVSSELLRNFAAKLLADQEVTYQELLGGLHDKAQRNANGIRQPGDDYGIGGPLIGG